MIDPAFLLAFLPAALALNLTPGADMMFCFGQGLRSGRRAAVAASLGISLGAMVHVLLAGIGLGALIARQPAMFEVIRWAGVAYLLVIAWRTLRAPLTAPEDAPVTPARHAFREALLVNLTNPKVILFVLALLPQFVNPALPTLPQFLVYGAVLALGGFLVNGAVGVFAGGLGTRLLRSARFERGIRWVSATIFAGLALRLAAMRHG
ncbi:Homoserine/homoserine lactone efflux protein [Pseudoruegeria aquimaris]|uniref:Homoserine/homoserine lactone efflux protein n=1 Tax=Pseudoruegeria aquimaris TaxID=393663 RepID=A0A1Y5TIU8_9RHOB|nr:LysE family translocator [Pseudoruegeria aquimaris]SLN62940.1 Homoserine/homoserine lactone efflux protein [Pseudoruegeria aquimaris]